MDVFKCKTITVGDVMWAAIDKIFTYYYGQSLTDRLFKQMTLETAAVKQEFILSHSYIMVGVVENCATHV